MIIAKTPLRISLFGGGTDFPDYFKDNVGMVLSATIDKYTTVILNKRPFDEKIRLGYSKTELVNSSYELEHELAREAIEMFHTTGIEITTISDVPGGTGLSTSSSILVGLLHVLSVYNNFSFDIEYLINRAINIEVKRLKKPIGYQDQIIVGKGGFRNIMFSTLYDDEYVFYHHKIKETTISELENSLVMFYIGGQRNSSDILEEQVNNIGKNFSVLQHIYEVCDSACDELENGNTYSIGKLLDESWSLKKSLASRISNPEIDTVYKQGIDFGSYGGKLLGAGGSGFLLFQIDESYKKEFIKKMTQKFSTIKHFPFKFEKYGTRIIFNNE